MNDWKPSIWVVLITAAVVWAPGCDFDEKVVEHPTGDEAWEQAHSTEVDDAELVATVNGHKISRRDVKYMWRDHPELSATEVLDKLVEREVLALEAKKQGFHKRPEVDFARKQGMISALLEEYVEADAEVDESMGDDMLRRVKAARRAPQGLRASHLVVLVPREAKDDTGEMRSLRRQDREPLFDPAREYVDRAMELLDGRVDDDALRQVARELNEELSDSEFEVAVNEHMRFPRHDEEYASEHLPEGWAGVVSEFAEGAESVADTDMRGQLSEPIRTEFGWHLIRVDDLIEAREVDEEAARQYVDAELLREARRQKLQQLFEGWVDGVNAQVYPEALGSAFDE